MRTEQIRSEHTRFSHLKSWRYASARLIAARVVVICVIGIFALSACSSKSAHPKNGLSEKQLVQALFELELLKSRNELLHNASPHAADSVFIRLKIQKKDYEEWIQYFSKKPTEYAKIRRQVVEKLAKERIIVP